MEGRLGATQVLSHYALSVRNVRVVKRKAEKSVWQVQTPRGAFALKRIPTTLRRAQFIAEAMRYLHGRGVLVPDVLPAADGSFVVGRDGNAYVMMSWVQGRKINYVRDMDGIVAALAEFHRASTGFVPSPKAEMHWLLGTWQEHCVKKEEELLSFIAAGNKRSTSRFAQLFLGEGQHFVDQIRRVNQRLETPAYREWVAKVRNETTLCHQDFASENLRVIGRRDVWVFDMDAVACDLPARDLRKLLNKVMKKRGAWDRATLARVVRGYQRHNPLSKSEWDVVEAELLFPHLFCGIASKFFQGRAPDWTAVKFLEKFRQVVMVERSKELVIPNLAQLAIG